MGVSENSGYPKTAIFKREHDDILMELEVSYLLTDLYGDNRFKMIFLFFSHLRQMEHMSDSLTQQSDDFLDLLLKSTIIHVTCLPWDPLQDVVVCLIVFS